MLKIKHKGKTRMSYLKGLRLISRLNLSVALNACFETVALQLHDCKVPFKFNVVLSVHRR